MHRSFFSRILQKMGKKQENSPTVTTEQGKEVNMEIFNEEITPNADIPAENSLTDEENQPFSKDSPALTLDSDLEILKAEFPELTELSGITQLKNPTRYGALRDLGLSPIEAYLATNQRAPLPDNRAHLTSGVPISARPPAFAMTKGQMSEARELFEGMSDAEIQKLYLKVTR